VTSLFFKLEKYHSLPFSSDKANLSFLAPGNYSIFVELYYSNITELYLIRSNNYDFIIYQNLSDKKSNKETIPDSDITGEKSGWAGSSVASYVVLVIIVLLLASTMLISSTEVGKYGFFGAITPFYSKTRKKKIDKNYGYKKGLILGYILGNPGENYTSIKRVLNLNNGALTYYLRILEEEGVIRSERDGMYKRFYPTHGQVTQEVLELTEVQKSIYQTIKEQLGITQNEISKKLDIPRQTVNYHVQLMESARLIKVEREGKNSHCFIVEEFSEVIA
jgi:DNA-binding MarR family transcriptional regulator